MTETDHAQRSDGSIADASRLDTNIHFWPETDELPD